ncbi:MAG: glycine C-acetyltransferase [Deltaproteobacteria bacterium]|nr:glycine C-acetyltransferase [Deltaproteobacteria bacterium]
MQKDPETIFQATLQEISHAGLLKEERILTSPQDAVIRLQDGREVLNFCSNNYLGLANNPQLIEAAREALKKYGFGLSSVRFICGTQDIHRRLEQRIAAFLGTEDAILYSSCFDANGGLFETLLDADCVVISDALNHASIIDGIRLCKATRLVYAHSDMAELEARLRQSRAAKMRLIATDGVFSMDGDVAQLSAICDLAEKYKAMVMVDDSHATGFFGRTGRGTLEHCNVMSRVDIITSTLGKALGGASGGFTASGKEIVALLRQKSRPYLFSNSVAPVVVYTCLEVLDLLDKEPQLRDRLRANATYFREKISGAGFDIKPGIHPIIPIMLYDARLAKVMAEDLLKKGIYVVAFSYPVVPLDQARIRVQVSAVHTQEQLDRCLKAFTEVGKQHGVI